MSVIDEIKQLEAQKKKLLSKAKAEALKAAQAAVRDLNDLGFDYSLSEGNKPKKTTNTGSKRKVRRSGIREQVLKKISASSVGMSRKEVIAAMGVTDTSGKQSVSNALAALKKAGSITNQNRKYSAVTSK